MKTIKLITIGIVIFLSNTAKAQVSINVNIGSPPLWGPVEHNDVQYYYLPDVEAYYDVPSAMFIFYEGGIWIHRAHLPHRYRHYDLYNGYKVILTDYHGNSPYHNHNIYKNKYKKGYHGAAQKTNGQHPGKGNQMNKSIKNSGNKQLQHQQSKQGNSKGNSKGNSGGKGKKH